MPPPKPGRLLIVDDEVELMTALCEMLTGQGYEAVGLASSREALQALQEQEFDLLLADLMMPDLDGIALLRAGLETDPHLVGIIMTGQGTVPTAVEAMKIGAFDYLLKPFKFNAVLPILARAMDVRRLRMENVQLRETTTVYELIQAIAFTLDSEAILNKVAEVALQQCEADEVSIMLPTEAGDELYVAVARGKRAENIVGKRAPLGQGVAGWVARYRELLALPGEVRDPRFAPLHPRPDIGFAISMPMIAGNQFVGVLNANTTRRRPFTPGQVKALTILTGAASAALEAARLYEQARRVEEKERLILENVDEVVYMIGISDDPFRGTTQFVSPRVKNIIGYRAEEFLNDPGLWAGLIHPDDISTIGSQTQAIYASGRSGTREYRLRHKTTGDYRWMEDRVTPLCDAAGKVVSVFGVARDITERRQTEDRLQFQADILRNVHDSVIVTDLEGKIVYWNEGASAIFGYSAAEMLGQTPTILYPDLDPEQLAVDLKNIMEGRDYVGDWKGRRKDGATVWVAIKTTLLRDAAGRATGFIGVAKDITERKRAEEALRQSEGRFRVALENSPIVVFNQDQELRYTWMYNPHPGFTPEAVLGKTDADLLPPEDAARLTEIKRGVLETGVMAREEVRTITGGQAFFYDLTVEPLRDASGNIVGVTSASVDITERKQAEEERGRLLNVLEKSLNEIYTFDAEMLRFQYVNYGARRNLGYELAQLQDMTPLDLKPEYTEASFRDMIRPLLRREKEAHVFETVHRRADGSVYPVEVHLQLVEHGGERVFLAVINDITGRRRTEETLKKLSSAVEQTADNVFICNRDGIIEYVNPAFAQLTGYTQAEAIGQTPQFLKSDQHIPRFFEKLWDTILAGGVFRATFINRKKSGELYYEEKTITPLRDDHGNITHFVSTGKDVTERMRAEAALEKSEAELRALFAAMPDVVVVYDRQGRYLKIAPTNTSLLYKPPDKMIGKTLPEVLPPPQANLLLEHIQRALDTQQTVMLDYSLNLGGQEIWFAGAISPMPGEAAILVAHDITERKWRERELEAIARVSAALRAAPTRGAMLPIILDQLIELFKVDGAALAMLDPATGEVVIELGREGWAAWKGVRLPMGEGVNGRVVATRRPYVNNDMRSDPLFARPDLLAGSNAVACVPLMVEERAIGTLWMGRGRAPGPALYSEITAEELRLLTAIADMAANAIHRATLHEQTLRYAVDLALAYDTTIEGWSRALDLRDKETEGHTLRVTEMVLRLARAMGVFSEEQLLHIRRGALLHDIGKMGIPDPILLKPGPLTDEEWVIMRKHPGYAHNLLSPIVYLLPALDIPYCHHEKWDGTGYPRQLTGEAIPLSARLFAVVDVWDALRSDRPYRPAWPEEKVRDHIQEQAGKHFDPKVIEAFLSMSNDTWF